MMNLQHKWNRILRAKELITEVKNLTWWYYRPHLISMCVEKEFDTDDNGGLVTYYCQSKTETIEPQTEDEIWIDAEYIPTRREILLECIIPFDEYTNEDVYCSDFSDHIPPIIEENGIDGNEVTLTNPYPTLEQIEALICEF